MNTFSMQNKSTNFNPYENSGCTKNIILASYVQELAVTLFDPRHTGMGTVFSHSSSSSSGTNSSGERWVQASVHSPPPQWFTVTQFLILRTFWPGRVCLESVWCSKRPHRSRYLRCRGGGVRLTSAGLTHPRQ